MCEDFKKTKKTEVTGYKVVAVKDGEYYSLLTGNKYFKNGNVPVWIEQNGNVSKYFDAVLAGSKERQDVLIAENYEHHGLWKRDMVGRTAAFKSVYDAENLKTLMEEYTKPPFKTIVVKVKLTVDLMQAMFGSDMVYVGKRMKIMEEM